MQGLLWRIEQRRLISARTGKLRIVLLRAHIILLGRQQQCKLIRSPIHKLYLWESGLVWNPIWIANLFWGFIVCIVQLSRISEQQQ